MANQYTDINVVEANRLHSEEAKAGNNENTSLWTNNLQDIIHLNPSDKVSVYGSFISERGAGQQSSIEVKGVELPFKKEIFYTKISNTGINNTNTTGYDIVKAELISDFFQLRDDTLRFSISYYIPSNAQNSLQLPRRWVYGRPDAADSLRNYTDQDTTDPAGASFTNYADTTGPNGIIWADRINYYKTQQSLYKFKNKNERFTFLIRDITHFVNGEGLGYPDYPAQDLRDPENAVYHTYKELKTFTIPSGFNSAQFVAEEITRQFQTIVSDRTISITEQDGAGDLDFPLGLSRVIESETYKKTKAWNVTDGSKANFLKWFNLNQATPPLGTSAGWNAGFGFEWQSQYQMIATKYPELYETGTQINMDKTGTNTGILGSFTQGFVSSTATDGWTTSIPYTKDNCDLVKAFLDAQLIYPEIINDLNGVFGLANEQTGYEPAFSVASNNIENTRWIHCNRFPNARMTLSADAATLANTQLGWGGYYQPRSGSNEPGRKSLHSGLCCLFFDNKHKDVYYKNPRTDLADVSRREYTYGCLGGQEGVDNYIIIYPDRHIVNGVGTDAYNQFMNTSTDVPPETGITDGTKLGFDLHFNAPGMYYLAPMSGWGKYPDDAWTHIASQNGNFEIPEFPNSGTLTGTKINTNSYKDMLYIGADNPSLVWDGTHFGFKGFHTGMNRGNKWSAGSPFAKQDEPDISFADVVYKVNPIENYNDFTPDRMPYRYGYNLKSYYALPPTVPGPDAIYAFKAPQLNDNLEKWGIYDMLGGVFLEDYGIPENLWDDSLWGILGFTYNQLNSKTNNRQLKIQSANSNNLSHLTTNAELVEGDTKIFSTNYMGTPLLNNMIQGPYNIKGWNGAQPAIDESNNAVYPPITHKTQSMTILAENLPTRMIRGYYTIRSNILEGTPFIGGKLNNTNMPVIGIVDKINGDGDFYFGQDSSLEFTITKPIRLASLSVSIHDPDGSYARTNNQSTILFKIQKSVNTTFNVVDELLQENKNDPTVKNIIP
tara:strand:- start:156 stop:3161 length:3006 start_codon:yes stop_codon:yes gene_type:complete